MEIVRTGLALGLRKQVTVRCRGKFLEANRINEAFNYRRREMSKEMIVNTTIAKANEIGDTRYLSGTSYRFLESLAEDMRMEKVSKIYGLKSSKIDQYKGINHEIPRH